jgi:protocatechuate 3,4-dioxygenase beta subunit
MIKIIITNIVLLLLYAGCGGSSEPYKSNHPDTGANNPVDGETKNVTRSIYSFTIYTKSSATNEANATASINNFHLQIQRSSNILFDSKNENSNYSVHANQDSSLTISSKERLKVGDIITLSADGFTPQQQSIDSAMLEANSMRVSLKPIGSRQVFELGALNSGRVTTRFAMGASTKVNGENVEFKTDDSSVVLNIKRSQIDRIAKRVSRSTKADKNTEIYLDITTVDPKTEYESAIGDFTYNPSKEPRSSKSSRVATSADTMLESVVMASISMTTSEGDEIHCFNGSDYNEATGECSSNNSVATLKMKIPSSQFEQYANKYNKGERTIPLYHYSKTEATWIRQVKDGKAVDGELILEDLNTNGIADEGDTLYLSGNVSHFSYWNGDMPRESIKLNGSIIVSSGAQIPSGTVVVSKGADYTGRSFRVPVSSNLTYNNLGAKTDAKVELYLQYPDGTKSESIFIQTTTKNQEVSENLICNYEVQEITLTVKDLDGNPIDGAVIKGAGSSSSTDKDGHVKVEVSKNSSTKVTASYNTGVFTTSSSKFVDTNDATIVLDTRSFKISGGVSFLDENGNTIDFKNGYVEIYDYESGLYNQVYVKNGTYELLLPYNKLKNGKNVTIRAGIFVPLYAKFIDKEQTITITDADMSAKNKSYNFSFTLQPFIVSGKVSNPFDSTSHNGIPNITVYSDTQSVQTDEDGNYQMLLFYREGGQTLRAYDPINGDVVRPTVINISENEQDQDHKNKNFVIDRRSANIEGSVINERGIPVQGVLVYTSYGWIGTSTDSEGKFKFEINDAALIGRSNIMLYVYDANDNTKLLGSQEISGKLQRGKTIEAGEISISTNIAPIIKSVTWDEPILGQPMNIYVDAYDPDNNQLKTTITFDGSEITVTQGIATITPQETGRLEFTTKVEEIDGEGLSAEVTQSMIVSENAKPVVSSITGFVKDFTKSSNMVINVNASDPEGATLNYRARLYDTFGNQVEKVSVSNNQITILNSIENGRYRLTIYISDGINEIERNFKFTADNNVAPKNLTISKESQSIADKVYVKTSDYTFELVANATDENGDTLTYTWSLNEALGTVSGSTLTIDPSGKVGIFPITVSVTDGKAYISKKITLVIENNLKPIINSITINPQTLTKVGNKLQDEQGNSVTKLTAQVSAVDPEGTALLYSFGEIVSNIAVKGFASDNTHTYDISSLGAGRHAFRVDVKDETGKTTSQRVLFEILENKPPRINSFFVPIKAKANTEVQLQAVAVDPEGDNVTYTWSASHNGTSLSIDNNTLSIGDLTGEIVITLEVSDGKNSVTRQRTIEIVQNNAPVINQFKVLPTVLKVGKTVQFSALASDPDLDNVTYKWYWDDTLISEEANGVLNIPTDSTAGTYILKLVVSDGKLSTQQTQSITVQELAAKPVVTLKSEKNQILVGTQTDITATVSIKSKLKWSVSQGGNIIVQTAGVTFSASSPGTYSVTVVATNEDGIQSEETTINIEVKSINLTLNSTNAIQAIGNEFTIDANLSDTSFTIPTDASWQITAKPENSTAQLQVDGTTAKITPDVIGSYTISLSFEIDGIAFNATQTIVANEDVINEENSVHGVVTGINGEILEGAKVRLYNADDSSLYDVTQTTNETGDYIFSDLPAGKYYLVVSGGNGYINQTEVVIIN